jgi:hypothetical protein
MQPILVEADLLEEWGYVNVVTIFKVYFTLSFDCKILLILSISVGWVSIFNPIKCY